MFSNSSFSISSSSSSDNVSKRISKEEKQVQGRKESNYSSDITIVSNDNVVVSKEESTPKKRVKRIRKDNEQFHRVNKKRYHNSNSKKINGKNCHSNFTFPNSGSVIVIRIENCDLDDEMRRKLRNMTRTLRGRVVNVIKIENDYVEIKAKYHDVCLNKNVSRIDKLPYQDYGFFKNWYVQEKATTENSIQYDFDRQDMETIEISPVDVPLSFRSKTSRAKIDNIDDIKCEICNSMETFTNSKRHMVLCDQCNKGYHQNCLTPSLDIVPSSIWFCQSCNKL